VSDRTAIKSGAGALAALWPLVLAAPPEAAAAEPADLVFRNGGVYTVDAARWWTEAVAVREGRIAYVGTNAGPRVTPDPRRGSWTSRDACCSPASRTRTCTRVAGWISERCGSTASSAARRCSAASRPGPKPTRSAPGSKAAAGRPAPSSRGVCPRARCSTGWSETGRPGSRPRTATRDGRAPARWRSRGSRGRRPTRPTGSSGGIPGPASRAGSSTRRRWTWSPATCPSRPMPSGWPATGPRCRSCAGWASPASWTRAPRSGPSAPTRRSGSAAS